MASMIDALKEKIGLGAKSDENDTEETKDTASEQDDQPGDSEDENKAGPLIIFEKPLEVKHPEEILQPDLLQSSMKLAHQSVELMQHSFVNAQINWFNTISQAIAPYLLPNESVRDNGVVHCDSVLIPHRIRQRHLRDCFIVLTDKRLIIFQNLLVMRPICQDPLTSLDAQRLPGAERESAKLINDRLLEYKVGLNEVLPYEYVVGASAESHFFYAMLMSNVRDVECDLRSLSLTIQPHGVVEEEEEIAPSPAVAPQQEVNCCLSMFPCCEPCYKIATCACFNCTLPKCPSFSFSCLINPCAWIRCCTGWFNQLFSCCQTNCMNCFNAVCCCCKANFVQFDGHPGQPGKHRKAPKQYDIIEKTKSFIQQDQHMLMLHDEPLPQDEEEAHLLQLKEKKARIGNKTDTISNSLVAHKRLLIFKYAAKPELKGSKAESKNENKEHHMVVRLADDVSPNQVALFISGCHAQLPLYQKL